MKIVRITKKIVMALVLVLLVSCGGGIAGNSGSTAENGKTGDNSGSSNYGSNTNGGTVSISTSISGPQPVVTSGTAEISNVSR